MKQFYPHLITRMLLFLRQQRYSEQDVHTDDLISKFHKSKSRISQALSNLNSKGYIERNYVSNINNNGSRHKISLTTRGLEIANAILLEGLDPLEKRVLEALKIRFNRSSYPLKKERSLQPL